MEPLADVLARQFPTRAAALRALLAEAEREGESEVGAVERAGLVDPAKFLDLIAARHKLPIAAARDFPKDPALLSQFSASFLRGNGLMPLRLEADGKLLVAVADPARAEPLEALSLAAGRALRLRVASARNILDHLDRLLPSAQAAGEEPEEEREIFGQDPPVVELLNRIFSDAANARATDIHIEPERKSVAVRLRVDGMLRPLLTIPHAMGRGLLARVKILSGLNVAERRLPQDGHLRQRIHAGEYDIRIATLPVAHGEAAVLRLLPGSRNLLALSEIGMSPDAMSGLEQAMQSSHGLIIATGPTGSGKTTTLASLVSGLNTPERKIVSIEDPVEYQIPGVNQTQVRPDIGITFANALRSFMRADPDVIMVGEMRDGETARIGVQASLTGHLVLSTLHTNSAAGAVTRLADMGVESYLLAACLKAVIGQRLVRVLCPHCREKVSAVPPFPDAIVRSLGGRPGRSIPLWRPVGCGHCGQSGYHGRAAIFELLLVDEKIAELIRANAATHEIEAVAVKSGMRLLMADGLAKAMAGLTSPEEVLRVANG